MGEILLRTSKDAFQALSPERAMMTNSIADNAGNLIFRNASQRILTTAQTRVRPDGHLVRADDADAINDRYDAYVLPLANAFRASYEKVLEEQTALIQRLRIPVVILGVGHQADVRNDASRIGHMDEAVSRFVRAVLDRGPSIGVRGEMTADYLRGLGFRDVEVIGCPSMFMNGASIATRPRLDALPQDAEVAITVSPYRSRMTPIVNRHVERYPNLVYVPQDIATLELLLWGPPGAPLPADDPRPVHLGHPLFRDDKVRFFTEPAPWIDFLAGRDFVFGSRIHGTIAALLAGTPAVLLAHDSRTLELAHYFGIPHRVLDQVDPQTVDAAELYAAADMSGVVDGHRERFDRFVGYLDAHRLDHVFRTAAPSPDYGTRAAATTWPEPVRASTALPPLAVGRLPRRLRARVKEIARSRRVRRAWRRMLLRRVP